MQAIILAGGIGTRLSGLLKGLPKPMVSINGKPFLSILMKKLINEGVSSLILSVGYRNEKIKRYFGNSYKSVPIYYSVEETPLGTGGAIKKSLEYVSDDTILIFNGDSFFDIDINNFFTFHKEHFCDISIAIKKTKQTDRYGTVVINKRHRITKFKEKAKVKNTYINCGSYVVNRKIFDNIDIKNNFFSFEKDILESNYKFLINGFASNGKFIDIGVPKDLIKAENFFKNLNDG